MPNVTTSQGFAIPEQADLLRDIISRAEDFFQFGPSGFPGQSTFVPFSPETREGFKRILPIAREGSPELNAASRLFGDTLSGNFAGSPGFQGLAQTARGDFLRPGTNPFLQETFNRQIAPGIRDNVNSQFIGSGRFGSAANTRVLADSLGNAANNLFGQNFARERGFQNDAASQLARLRLGATTFAPQLGQARLGELNQLINIGGLQEAQERDRLQNPIDRLQQLQSLGFGGPVPTTQRQNLPTNTLGNIFGGALTGGVLTGSPFGAIGGGLLGGFLG